MVAVRPGLAIADGANAAVQILGRRFRLPCGCRRSRRGPTNSDRGKIRSSAFPCGRVATACRGRYRFPDSRRRRARIRCCACGRERLHPSQTIGSRGPPQFRALVGDGAFRRPESRGRLCRKLARETSRARTSCSRASSGWRKAGCGKGVCGFDTRAMSVSHSRGRIG